MNNKNFPPEFKPTIQWIDDAAAGEELPPMFVLNMGDGYAHLLGEKWQVEKIVSVLTAFLETGETAGEMDDLAEELGFKWINTTEAQEIARSLYGQIIPARTIRKAAQTGAIRKAIKSGRDWRFSKSRFIGWINNRPKPGPKK